MRQCDPVRAFRRCFQRNRTRAAIPYWRAHFLTKLGPRNPGQVNKLQNVLLASDVYLATQDNPFRVVGQNTEPHRPLTDPWDL